MSEDKKKTEEKQQSSKDENIAKIINKVIIVLNTMKKQAQSLYDNKIPSSVKCSLKQAVHQASDGIKKVSNTCMTSKQACVAKVKKNDKADK